MKKEKENKETQRDMKKWRTSFLLHICRTNFRHRYVLIFTLELIGCSSEFSIH